MDCIVLVGNRDNYRELADDNNKAFLRVGDKTILHIMMEQLSQVDEIDRLLLVGPQSRLEDHLAEIYPDGFAKPVLVIEQKQDLLENVLAALDATQEGQPKDRYVLMLPSDIPMLTAGEVRQFVARADMECYDFVTGFVSKEALALFAPTEDKPGIVMHCFYLNTGSFRVSNMHMVRPAAITNIDDVRRVYGLRYQKQFRNMLKVFWLMLVHMPGGLLFYLGMRISNRLRIWGWNKMARSVEKMLKQRKAEKEISGRLGGRFKVITTDFGGTAVDVDNDTDYNTVKLRYQEWMTKLTKME